MKRVAMKRFSVVSVVGLVAGVLATLGLGALTAGPAQAGVATADLTVNGLPAVVPAPVSMASVPGGSFTITSATRIVVQNDPGGVMRVADDLAAILRPSTGYSLPVVPRSGGPAPHAIVLQVSPSAGIGDEGYLLDVTRGAVHLSANTPAGLFHGVQTLLQLLPTQIESSSVQPGPWIAPGVSIVDYPRYPYRGVMIDVARHFYSVANIERVIDQAAMYKLNVLHLHLSDDQGWRIAINAYPDLTTVGSNVAGRTGFYTQQDYRDIVAYAAARFITVVPEIDGPAHTTAAVTAMATGTDPADIPIDPANPADNANVETFLTHVIDEISALSPGPYFHIGGDEASLPAGQYDHWVTAAGTASVGAGKTAMGWSQVGADPGLPAGSVLQYWSLKSGNDTGDGLAPGLLNGDKLVLSPYDATYFDTKYDPSTPLGLTYGYLPLSKAYDWNPDAVVSEIYAANHLTITDNRLLGVEAELWADTVPANWTDAQVPTYSDFMLLPRLPALAEVGWSPQSTHDWTNFAARVATQGPRWTSLGYHFYASPEVHWIGYVPLPTVSSTVVNGAAVSTSPATLDGTGVAGDTVTVTEGSGPVCAATVGDDSRWSCAPAAPLSNGQHQIVLVQTDPDGYRSAALTVVFTVGAKPLLLDYWSMDETSGTAVADSAGPYSGTRTGGATITAGKVGNGLAFDGTGSGSVSTGAPDLPAPWSVGIWVRPTATVDIATLLRGSSTALKLQQDGTGEVGITHFGVADYASTYAAPLNTWTYLTLVDDGTSTAVYANGQPVATINASIALGRATIGDKQLTGAIDELTVFGNALTADQAAALYAASGVLSPVPQPTVSTVVNGAAVSTSPATLDGTGVAGDTVTVTEGSGPVCAATVGDDSRWSCAPAAPLSNGQDQIVLVQTDPDGYRSAAVTVVFTVGANPLLLDYWSMDETSGTAVADSAGPYSGTRTSGATITAGKVGNGLAFDGTGSGSVSTGAPDLPAPWSVGIWVRPTATAVDSATLLAGDSTALKLQQSIGTGEVGITHFGVADYASTYAAPLNTWTYLTLVDDGTSTAVYANGQPVATINASIALGRATIGGRPVGTNERLTGAIDELTVFGNALTADQAAALYAASGVPSPDAS